MEQPIYIKSKTHPGHYEYHPDHAAELRAGDAYLWNVVAVEKLDALMKRLSESGK